MKNFIITIALIAICGFANDCFAGEQQRGVRFKCVTPCDVLLGVGAFVEDTGRNVVGGVRTTVTGLGELITAPFRARICVPKKRTFHYRPPRIEYMPGNLEEIKPPVIELPSREPNVTPLYFLPAPATSTAFKKVA